jgi:hypothetical protein
MPLAYRFILTAVRCVILGMLLGLYMGPSQDFTLLPVHVHLNLLGWTTLMLIGLYYRSDAVAAATPLARWHFWVALVGTILFAVGLTGLYLDNPGFETILIVGAVLSLVSMLIFAWVVWQGSQRSA